MAKGKRLGVQHPSTPPRRPQGPTSSIQCSECGKIVRRPRAQKGPAGEKTCCTDCFEGLQQHFVPLQQAQLGQAVSWAGQAVKAAVRLRSNVGYLLSQQLARDVEYLGREPFAEDEDQELQQEQHQADKHTCPPQQQANLGAAAAEAAGSHPTAAAASRGSPSPVATPSGVAPGSVAAADGTASGSSSGMTEADASRSSPVADTAAAAAGEAPAADAAAAAADALAQDPEWQAYVARQAASGFQEVYYYGDASLERNLGDAYDPPLPGCWGMAALAGVGAVVQEAECMRNEGPAAYRQLLPDAALGQLEELPRPAATANQLYSARAALERFLTVLSSIAKDDPTRFTASQVAGALHSSGPLPLRQPVPRALPEEAWEQQQQALAAAHQGVGALVAGPRGGAGRSSRNSSPAPRGPSPGPGHLDLGFNLAAVPRGKRTQAARGASPAVLPPVLTAVGGAAAPPMGSSRPNAGGLATTAAPYSSAWGAGGQQERKRPREELSSPAVGPATTAALTTAALGGGYGSLPPPAFDLPPAALAGINTIVNAPGVGWAKGAAQQHHQQQQQQQQAGRRSSGYLWGMPVGLPPGTARYNSWFDQQAGPQGPQQYGQQAQALAGLYGRYNQAPSLQQQQHQQQYTGPVSRPLGRLNGHPAQLPPMSVSNTAPPPAVALPAGAVAGGAASARGGLSSPIKSRLVGGGPLIGGCGSAFAPVGTIFSAADCLRAQAAAAAGSSGAGFAEEEGTQQYVHSAAPWYSHNAAPQLPQAYDMLQGPPAAAAPGMAGAAAAAGEALPPATGYGMPRRSSDSGVWEGVAGGPSKRPRQVPVGLAL